MKNKLKLDFDRGIIASFSGAQSTGKTTLLDKLGGGLQDHGWMIIPEVTRYIRDKFNVDINEAGDNITQSLIINQHLANCLVSLEHIKDNPRTGVLLDRCILDGFIYTVWLYNQGKVDKVILDQAYYFYDELIDKIDVIFYTDPTDVDLVDDGERSTNSEFRKQIITLFEGKIKNCSFVKQKLVRLKGTVLERENQMMDVLFPAAV